jgi:hypothetical protein
MKIQNALLLLASLSTILMASCATVEKSTARVAKAGEPIADREADIAKGNGLNPQGQASVIIGRESFDSSLYACSGYMAAPAVLGTGLALGVPVIGPIFGGAYVATAYGQCVYFRQYDQQRTLDLSPAIMEAKRETAKELREAFAKAADRLKERADSLNADIDRVQGKLRTTGEEERAAIQRTGAKAVLDLYEEIRAIQSGHGKQEDETTTIDVEMKEMIPGAVR